MPSLSAHLEQICCRCWNQSAAMAEASTAAASRPASRAPKKKEHQRFPTNVDMVAQNNLYKEMYTKLDATEIRAAEFRINPVTTVPLTEKPTRITPAVPVSQQEFEEAKKLLDDVFPIKNVDMAPPDKYEVPMTASQEYGWCSQPLVKPKKLFHHPHQSCEITQFASSYYECMQRSPFSKKGFIPRYQLKEQERARLAAEQAAAAPAPAAQAPNGKETTPALTAPI